MRVLVVDIGSSSVRGAIFTEAGSARNVIGRKYRLRSTPAGAAELGAEDLCGAALSILRSLTSDRHRIDAVGGCAFWHGLLGLDERLRPCTPVYTWADSRSVLDAAELRAVCNEDLVLQQTGCMLRFPFWPAKLRWISRTKRALFRRVRFWVSPADWIMQQYSGELATSISMASATGLYDQCAQDWDAELCAAVNVLPTQLPPVRAEVIPGNFSLIGDGAAGNLGCGAVRRGVAAINLGTSAAVRLMQNRREEVPWGMFRYVVERDRFVMGGALSNAGNVQAWCRRELRLGDRSNFSRTAAASDSTVAQLHLVRERAPDWPESKGLIYGVSEATSARQLFRAASVGTFDRIARVLELLENATNRINRVIVSGGMTKSSGLMALFADVLGRDLEIAREREASLGGAAAYVFQQLGVEMSAPPEGRRVLCRRDLARRHQRRREGEKSLALKMDEKRLLL